MSNTLQSPIDAIPGIGPVTRSKLHNDNIFNIGQLLAVHRDIPGTNTQRLQTMARRSMAKDTVVSQHTWYGHHAHVLVGSTVRRAVLGNIVVGPHGARLQVAWVHPDGTWRTRTVSLMAVAAIHSSWVRCDVLSDDDEPPHRIEQRDADHTQPVVDTYLPRLLVSDVVRQGRFEHRAAISSAAREVNAFLVAMRLI